MAAFSSSSSFLDSSLFPTINFDPFSSDHIYHQNLDHTFCNNNDPSLLVTNKNSMDSSSVITDYKYCDQKFITHQNPIPMDRKRKSKHSSNSPNSAQSKDMRREVKGKKQKKMKDCEEEKQEAPTGYIHVRARRGQATDSHSLAERVRRERISERMKQLQALVPGCEKVTGKALMLDEIINYVQSLQNQVEFLSMKLASVNPIFYDFGMDLESLMARPEQSLSSLPSPFPGSMQECSPTTPNNYHVLDNSANSLLLQQPHLTNTFPQGERQVVWEVDEQRQKIINQSAINNSLFSFPLM